MSCSMTTIVSVRLSSAISSASRAVPSAPSPAVGSSRNRMRGSVASASAISSARRSPYARSFAGARSVPRGRRARAAPAARSCAAPYRADGRARRRTPRARIRGSATSTLSSAGVLIEQADRLERARRRRGARSPRATAGDVGAVEQHAAAIRRVVPRQQIEARRLAGTVGPHDARQRPSSNARSIRSSTMRSPKRLCRALASKSAMSAACARAPVAGRCRRNSCHSRQGPRASTARPP